MSTNTSQSMGTEILANLEGFLKKFRITKENEKDREILTLANLDSGYIRKFIVKKVDERSLFRRRSSQKSLKDENENKSRRNSKNKLKNGDAKKLKSRKSKNDDRRHSTGSLDSIRSNLSQKSTFSFRSFAFGSTSNLKASKKSLKSNQRSKSIDNLGDLKKKRQKKRSSDFGLGRLNFGFGSSSESEPEDEEENMTVRGLDEEGDPGVVNPAFIEEDLKDEGVDLEKDKEFAVDRVEGDGMSDTDSISTNDSASSDAEPKFNLKMSPRPLRRSHKNRSPQHSPDSYRSSYQSNRSSVCSTTMKGILKKAASSTTINLEMTSISQSQTPTENGHTSKFTDPFEDCENGDPPKFVRSTDETGLQHQRSFNRVKFILDSGRPDNVTGDYDDIKIEKNNERDRSSDRSKNLPDKEDGNGLSKSSRKCLIFAFGLLVLTLAVILGSLFGSHKLNNYALKGATPPLDDKFIRNAIEGRFKITNKEFSEALHNYESDEFKKMSKDLEALIAKVIYHEATPNQANSTVTLRIIKILKGSIVPIFRIKWTNKDLLDDSEIRMRILRHLDKFGSIGEYKVDKTSVSVSDLQNHCHKSLFDCSHTCVFSPQTLKFLCRCPDTLVLTNNTLCISPQQTTRKMPFIVPPVVNNIIKDSGAQFHSVNPETVEKKAPEGETAAEDGDKAKSPEPTPKNVTVSANTTTTAAPTSAGATSVKTSKPEPETPPVSTTTLSSTAASTMESTETPLVTTTTERNTDGQNVIEDVQITLPMSIASDVTTTPVPPVKEESAGEKEPAQSESESPDTALENQVAEGESVDAETPDSKTTINSSQDETPGEDSSQGTTTPASRPINSTETTSSVSSTTSTQSPMAKANQTEQTVETSTLSSVNDTSTTQISPSSTTSVSTDESPKESVLSTTELTPSSSSVDGIVLTSENSTIKESMDAVNGTANMTVSAGTTTTPSSVSDTSNTTIVTTANTTTIISNITVAENTGQDNSSTKEVVTVQAIPLAKLPTVTSTTPSSVNVSTSTSSSSPSISGPNITEGNNSSAENPIQIGVIADVSNSLSFGGQEATAGQEKDAIIPVPQNVTAEDPKPAAPEEPAPLCGGGEFECESGSSRYGKCIPKSAQCDSVYDCYDQSDEKSCIENKCLANYQCWSGDCIQRKFVCDGIRHCPDGRDEDGCETWKCSEDEFQCDSHDGSGKVCIPMEQKCDGQSDCANHTDEKGCATECSGDQFLCPEGWCIPNLWKCDGTPDCTGGEDELECDCDGLDQSPCTVGGCVPTFKLCDGLRQCPDGSDEYGCLRIDNSTKQLEIRSEEKRWSAVCGDKWTAGWTELVCEQLGFGEAVSTEVRKVNESVPKPRVKLSPDAPKGAQRGRAPLQYFLTPGECATNPLVHISCKQPTCGKWTRGSTSSSGVSEDNPAWPSMGLLIQPGSYDDINLAFSHSCSATLITPAWVIASYSCLSAKPNGLEADKWAFLIGESAPRVGQRKTQLRHAKQVVMYPGAKRKNGIWVGDAVLLRLQSSVQLDDAAQLACLPDKPAGTHSHCKIITWKENKNKDEGGLVQHVQKLPVPNLTAKTCNTSYYGGQLEPEHACASFVQPSHSPCNGNEGSPLMCKGSDDTWQLHGLLSLTSTCARFDLPSLFTDINSINQWILNTVERSPIVNVPLTTTTTPPPSVAPPVARSVAHREALSAAAEAEDA